MSLGRFFSFYLFFATFDNIGIVPTQGYEVKNSDKNPDEKRWVDEGFA